MSVSATFHQMTREFSSPLHSLFSSKDVRWSSELFVYSAVIVFANGYWSYLLVIATGNGYWSLLLVIAIPEAF